VAPAVFLMLVLAQSPPAEAGEAAQIERIRKALTEIDAITVAPQTGVKGPVFRVTVKGQRPLPPLWDNWSAVPTNIRPWFRGYHHEYLERVTSDRVFPEELRGATLYPMGQITTGMIESLVKLIKAANRKGGEAAARREVQQALDEFRACQANRDRPGC
jgi:hypothetical protein